MRGKTNKKYTHCSYLPLTLQIYIKSLIKTNYLAKKTLQRAKLKIKLSKAFSFVMWSTIPPIPLKAILDPLKCKIEAFYYNNQTPPIFSDKWGYK